MRAVTGGTKRTIAGVLATGVILFAGIAGQAQAGADGCKVTFGGWITTADGDKATFGGNSHAVGQKGQIEYQDHGPVTDINVHSIEVHSLTCGGDVGVSGVFGLAGLRAQQLRHPGEHLRHGDDRRQKARSTTRST